MRVIPKLHLNKTVEKDPEEVVMIEAHLATNVITANKVTLKTCDSMNAADQSQLKASSLILLVPKNLAQSSKIL